MIQLADWCSNSRRWIDFMFLKLPDTCPFYQDGLRTCVHSQCGYYETRKITRHYKMIKRIFTNTEAQ